MVAALEGAASGVAGVVGRCAPALRSVAPPPGVAESVSSEISFGFVDSLGETWLCEGEWSTAGSMCGACSCCVFTSERACTDLSPPSVEWRPKAMVPATPRAVAALSVVVRAC
ncbi:hypothetical protein SANT12839_087530 [Streptomyces antimycoticus]|uniref:Uncharacterized protein n=1 Tax=Streptomyces antimycoticus TaxID=68175 RepID=A0A4D4KFC9_9ACTN|nr:hypothetical protein SANT12839_087530 [Streptomyces antimycoticus]